MEQTIIDILNRLYAFTFTDTFVGICVAMSVCIGVIALVAPKPKFED